jgi:hypothetical protein
MPSSLSSSTTARWARIRRGTALAAATLALTGCNLSGLQFHDDQRLHFDQPKARALVTTPVTVSWSMKGFTATGLDGKKATGQGAFVLFLDQAPMKVGKDLKSIASSDASCLRDPRCPDASYLAQRGVYVTSDPSVTLTTITAQSDGVGNEQHFVNVIIVDGAGRRMTESAWYLPFQTKRRSRS